METVTRNVASPVIGYVDRVEPGRIGGWAMNSEEPLRRCSIHARHKGRIVAEANADTFREDLLAGGYGDGRYGFTLQIPGRIKSGDIEIVESVTGTSLNGSPVSLMLDKCDAHAPGMPLILLDVSDLIAHLERHDQLSGIQRVQASVLEAIVADALVQMSRIRVVCYADRDHSFYELPVSFVCAVIEDTRRSAGDRDFRRHDDGRLHLLERVARKQLSLSDEEAASAVLVMLGTVAWEFPAYFDALRAIKRRGAKFVPLFYDLIPVTMSQTCGPGVPEAFKALLHRSVLNADHVLALSEHTRRDLVDYCDAQGLHCAPISVVKTAQNLGVISKIEHVRREIDGDYVLFVSTIEGRKNHALALRVWERLRAEYGDGIPTLVLVGRVGWRAEEFLERLHETRFLDGKVVVLSDVSDETLASLYKHCMFTIFPSLYEGWGLPVGESLSFGKVCLASKAASVPEAGGDFAVYFDPHSSDDALEKARRLIFDDSWRHELEENIAKNFKPITWTDVALNIIHGASVPAQGQIGTTAPLLDVGEYSFASASLVQRRDANQTDIYLREFSRPLISNKPLGLDHYVRGEACVSEGPLFAPEDWGRWGHRQGNTIEFRTPDPKMNYLVFLKIALPGSFVPAIIEIAGPRGVDRICTVSDSSALLRLQTLPFTSAGVVRIKIRLRHTASEQIDGDDRQLGIGFARLAVVQDTLDQRLDVLERLAYL